MTRKAAKIRIGDDPENPAKWKDVPPRTETIDLSSDDELDDVLADFPQNDACIQLFRINAQGGRPAFLEELIPVDFSFASVKRDYGGGRYMAKGKYADGTRKKMSFEIEGEPIVVRRKHVNTDPLAPVLPTGARSIETEAIQPTRADGENFQTALMAMMGKMLQQSQASEMQILEKMRMYKDLFGNQNVKEAPLETALNMFQKGVEMAALNGGGGGDNQSFWLMAIREMKDPLLKIVDTIQAAIAKPPTQINPGQSMSRASAAVQAGAAEQTEAKEGDPMLTLLPIIKSFLPSLINGASKNSDPGLYVDFLLDQIPTTAYPGFRDWLMKPGCLDQLAMIEPGVRFQREWWEALRAALIDGLSEELNGSSNVQPSATHKPATGHAEHDGELS